LWCFCKHTALLCLALQKHTTRSTHSLTHPLTHTMSTLINLIRSKFNTYTYLAKFYYKNFRMMRELEENGELVGKALHQKATHLMQNQESKFNDVFEKRISQIEHLETLQKHLKEKRPELSKQAMKQARMTMERGQVLEDGDLETDVKNMKEKQNKNGFTNQEALMVDIFKDMLGKEVKKVLGNEFDDVHNLGKESESFETKNFEAKKHAFANKASQRQQEKNDKLEAARKRLMERRKAGATGAASTSAQTTSKPPPQEQV